MDKLKKMLRNNDVVIVSHQGLGGGNIVLNTYRAFKNAINNGATMLELDISRTKDGVYYVFHQDLEPFRLALLDKKICDFTSEELDNMYLRNSDHVETNQRVERVSSMLPKFKGDILLNLDKCWMYGKELLDFLDTLDMGDQIILKSEWLEDYIKVVNNHKAKYMFMPVVKSKEDVDRFLSSTDLNIVGFEVIFDNLEDEHVKHESLKSLRDKGYFLWANAINLGKGYCLTADYDDDTSVLDSPEKGWGKLIEMGFNLIQTDWPYMLRDYLKGL